jgi:hypothetical protein
MRATRDLRRQCLHLARTRGDLFAQRPHPQSPSQLPASGHTIAHHTNRDEVAERGAAPAVPTRSAVALALRGNDAARRRAVARSLLNAATPPNATTHELLRTVPGIGARLRRVRREAMHARQRCPRVPAFVSDGRLGMCANASAGPRDGTSGTKLGHASRTGACAAAAVRCLRAHPAGPTDRGRLKHTPGQGPAWTVWAHTRARAVEDRGQRDPAVARPTVRTRERERCGRAWRRTGHRREPPGTTALAVRSHGVLERVGAGRRDRPAPVAVLGRSRRRVCIRRGRLRMTWAAPHPHLERTGARDPFRRWSAEAGMQAPLGCSTAADAPAVARPSPARRRARRHPCVGQPRAVGACLWP